MDKNYTTKNEEQILCRYRDEAINLNPVPLTLIGESLRIKKSSNYFVGDGIEVGLLFDEHKNISQVRLGPEIVMSLSTLKKGLEVAPFGLIPVHTLQLSEDFDHIKGGHIRFGYLKKIICLKSVAIVVKRLSTFFLAREVGHPSRIGADIANYWQNHFGENHWGTYEAVVKKTPSGIWYIHSKDKSDSIKELVAEFQVSKTGIAIGINRMYCHFNTSQDKNINTKGEFDYGQL